MRQRVIVRRGLVTCVIAAAFALGCSWQNLIIVTYLPRDGRCGPTLLPPLVDLNGTAFTSHPFDRCSGAVAYENAAKTQTVYAKFRTFTRHVDPVGEIRECELLVAIPAMNLPSGPLERETQGRVREALVTADGFARAFDPGPAPRFVPSFGGYVIKGGDLSEVLPEVCR